MRLFDSTVAECVLWGTESWTPRAEELRRMSVAQQTMLRRIVGSGRRKDEPWSDWIQRATGRARQVARSAAVKEWVPEHFRRKWNWAGKVARTPLTEWVYKVTSWRDSSWQAMANDLGALRPFRPSRRRWMRFEDCLRRFCSDSGLGDWQVKAGETEVWKELSADFMRWAAEAKFDD